MVTKAEEALASLGSLPKVIGLLAFRGSVGGLRR